MAVCSGSDKICDVFTSSHTSNTGRVTGSVSGKTDYLVVGKSPGFSKVSKARKNPRTKLIGLRDLGFGLEAGVIENKNVPPLLIKNFSEGYKGNGLARIANQSQWHQASGTTPSKTKNANNDSSSSSHDKSSENFSTRDTHSKNKSSSSSAQSSKNTAGKKKKKTSTKKKNAKK